MALCKLVFLCLIVFVQSANKTFVATEDWKTIEEGEVLPAGLHVRINMQTGKKEAKLLGKEETVKKENSALIEVESEKSKNDIDPDKIKSYLKSVKQNNQEVGEKPKKFRSFDEIKQDLGHMTDQMFNKIEEMFNVVQKFEMLVDNGAATDYEEVTGFITELTHSVHNYDAAVEFIKLDGIPRVVFRCWNMTDQDDLRAASLTLLGTLVENNPVGQEVAVNLGVTQMLLKALALEKNPLIRKRTGFALAALLRNCKPAQLKFLHEGGLSVFSSIIDDPKDHGDQLKLRIVTLLGDLLVEDGSMQGEGKKPLINWQTALRENGWCSRVAEWFIKLEDWSSRAKSLISEGIDHDMSLNSMELVYVLREECSTDFITNKNLVNAVNYAQVLYVDLLFRDMDEGETDSRYTHFVRVLQLLTLMLLQNKTYSDEL